MTYRKTFEVTGFVPADEGIVLCLACANHRAGADVRTFAADFPGEPVFLGSEFDYQPSCDVCREPVECSVIVSDGARTNALRPIEDDGE